jgi:hypothetical protein
VRKWDLSRGVSVDWPSHNIGSKDYMILEGSKRKTEGAPGCFNRQGSRKPGARPRRKTDRGERGDLKDVLTSGGAQWEAPDFGGDGAGGRLGLQAMAVLQRPVCYGDMLVGHGSASRSPGHSRLAPLVLPCVESRGGRRLAAPATALCRGGARCGAGELGRWMARARKHERPTFIGAQGFACAWRACQGRLAAAAVSAMDTAASSLDGPERVSGWARWRCGSGLRARPG